MPTLDEIRSQPKAQPRRAERSMTICLAPDLVAEVQQLNAELADLYDQHARAMEEFRSKPIRVGVKPPDPPRRINEIRDAMSSLLDRMTADEGELRIRSIDDGEWRRWVDAHPPRGEDEPGHDRDQEVALGYCNADALIDDLGRYAWSWDGAPLTDGDWDQHFAALVSLPDKKQIALAVVTMHETRQDFRQWRSGLHANLHRSRDVASPEPSGSPHDDSTGGSPTSDTSTTTPTDA